MSRQPRWSRRSAARPGEIVSAALDLFSERGFAATRLEDVAERAGVSKATIYLYFANKQDLFFAIIRDTVLPRVDAIERRARDGTGSSAQRVRALIAAFGEIVSTTRIGAVAKLILAESGNFPEVVDFYYDNVVRRGVAAVSGIVAAGIAAGEFRRCDPDDAARLIVFPILMSFLWSGAFGRRAPLDRDAFLRLHADTVLGGLASRSGGDA